MHLGIDRLVRRDIRPDLLSRLTGSRIGMLTNDLALTSDLVRGRQALHEAGWTFSLLFGPEHGLSGRAREGEHVGDLTDPVTGVEVRSLYGDHVRPSASDLAGLDVVLVDLPDVGARFYTYVWTMSHLLEACADAGVAVVVLDRPNPIGGRLDRAEGPMLDERGQSLVGRWTMPIRHGLTIGELARHWVRTRGIDVDLDVIEVQGWSRDASIDGQERTWMPPSPNLPSPTTTLLYPGTCLAEGVNVSEGRSTAVPFRAIAAPFIDGERYAAAIRDENLPGLAAVPYGFTPLVRDHAGEACEGVILHVTDADALRPVHAGARLLSLIEEIHPGALEERSLIPMPGESDWTPIEKLFGVRGAFAQITAGEWNDPARFAVPDWADAVAADLLYS
ncbi:exo-beta-N-acetylmuramidase NamZ domain-containing protein [Microbacterium sp. 179-I 3D4 NHS]|uniref:exo-beta-N-acetylmuramidase NamZ family protein n=1 Tax=Microbacterium sp. 179-I 3D4 NHS TaxID=3142381 RepID=UPI0039A27134